MGNVHDSIDRNARTFIEQQYMFFVSTAPEHGGHINLSPKGLDTLRIVDHRTLVYLDYVGSGAETIAHLRQNGRIVMMFCAFDGPPKIVRIHGTGTAIEPQDDGYQEYRQLFPSSSGVRSIIRVAVNRVSESCGFGVPLYAYEGQREQLASWIERKGDSGLIEYQQQKNRSSIDTLPALKWTNAPHSV